MSQTVEFPNQFKRKIVSWDQILNGEKLNSNRFNQNTKN